MNDKINVENGTGSTEKNLNIESSINSEISNTSINRHPKKKSIIFFAFLVIFLIACLFGGYYYWQESKDLTEVKTNNEVEQKVYSSSYKIESNSLSDFDLKFLQLENKEVNKVYSPLSIKYALAMLYEGSNGETKKQIESVIGDYQANKYFNTRNMSFANVLFIKSTFKDGIKSDYISNIKNKFNGDVVYDSFDNSSTINKWISDKTLNLINNSFEDKDLKDLNLALINALAIDMNWVANIQADNMHYSDEYRINYNHENYNDYIGVLGENDYYKLKFNNSDNDYSALQIGASVNYYDIINTLGEDNIRATITKEYNAAIANGECGGLYKSKKNDMTTAEIVDEFINELKVNYARIDNSTDFQFYTDDNVKVFAKDLKKYNGTTLQYIGIMPTNVSLTEYISNSKAEDLNQLINNLKDFQLSNFDSGFVTKIKGYIPIFNYNYDLNLMADLKEIGITDVFDANKADLSGITNTQEYIDKAVHKANINFSNEGIKASAITEGGGRGSAGCWFEHLYDVPVKVIDLTFDKPYVYIIRDKDSGEVWFMGTVYEPSVWQSFSEFNN